MSEPTAYDKEEYQYNPYHSANPPKMIDEGTTFVRPESGSKLLTVTHKENGMVVLTDEHQDTFVFDLVAVHERLLEGKWERVPTRRDGKDLLEVKYGVEL